MRRRWTVLLAATVGCVSFGATRFHGATSDHFDGKHFHNYESTPEHQLSDFARKYDEFRVRGKWDDWQEMPTATPPPRVSGGTIRVTFVNHATVLLQLDGLNILTDPVWSKRISPVGFAGPARHRPPGIRFEDLPPIDVVLISHNHYDHMDVPTLRRLSDRFHPRIVTGLGNSHFLERNSVTGAEDIDWWNTVEIAPGVRLTGVPARHWSARSLLDHDRTLWLGFIIEGPSGRIYFAGDTGLGEFMTTIHERFPSFSLALLPIAPGRPREVMAARHMSAGDAVNAMLQLNAASAMALHFGTFQQGDDGQAEPVDSLNAALSSHALPNDRFRALRNGESFEIHRKSP